MKKLKLIKSVLLVVFIFLFTVLTAFPKINYDFHTSSSPISAIASGMGGNPIYSEDDPFTAYFNPASSEFVKKENIGISYKYSPKSPESIYQSVDLVNFVKKGQLLGVAMSAPKGSVFFRSLIDDHLNQLLDSSHKTYKDFTLNSFQLAISEKQKNFIFGLTGKYIYGRLVNLNQKLVENNWETESFFDDKARGFSFDFSSIYQKNNIVVGVTFYDLLSKIYWEDSSDKNLVKRISYGIQSNKENSLFYISVLQKAALKAGKEYHFGYDKNISGKIPGIHLRWGVYSKDFKSEDNIFFSFGTTYTIKSFKIDIAIINSQWLLENNQYLATISLGR